LTCKKESNILWHGNFGPQGDGKKTKNEHLLFLSLTLWGRFGGGLK